MFTRTVLKVLFLISFIFTPTTALAVTGGIDKLLLLYFEESEIYVTSPTRSEKPISKVAENITVITAQEIEDMNAQTLGDVLYYISGVQVERFAGPGVTSFASIQGADYTQVRVVRDGITLNRQSEKWADIALITMNNVEKIEIIKGPASAVWGSSLGGIIHITTKPAFAPEKLHGGVTFSKGEWGVETLKGDVVE